MKKFFSFSWTALKGFFIILVLFTSVFAPMLIADGLMEKLHMVQTSDIRMIVFCIWALWRVTLSFMLGRALE